MTKPPDNNDDNEIGAELRRLWASPSASELAGLSSEPGPLADQIAAAHRADERRLLWLSAQEILPALGVSAYFAWAAAGSSRPWALLVAGAIGLGVAGYLAVTTIRHRRSDRRFGQQLDARLGQRVGQLRHFAELYRRVLWWYLLPIAVAVVFARLGLRGSIGTSPGDIAYFASVAGLGTALYVVNRRLGRTKYGNEADRLEVILTEARNSL